MINILFYRLIQDTSLSEYFWGDCIFKMFVSFDVVVINSYLFVYRVTKHSDILNIYMVYNIFIATIYFIQFIFSFYVIFIIKIESLWFNYMGSELLFVVSMFFVLPCRGTIIYNVCNAQTIFVSPNIIHLFKMFQYICFYLNDALFHRTHAWKYVIIINVIRFILSDLKFNLNTYMIFPNDFFSPYIAKMFHIWSKQ